MQNKTIARRLQKELNELEIMIGGYKDFRERRRNGFQTGPTAPLTVDQVCELFRGAIKISIAR